MHASQRNQNRLPAAAQTGNRQQRSRKTMRLTFATNGTYFEVQGDTREDGGVNLHVMTDGDVAELTIQCIEADAVLPTLRVFHEHSA